MRRITLFPLVASLVACTGGVDVPDGNAPFKLVSYSPDSVIPGTRLVVEGEGFLANDAMKLSFDGNVTRRDGSSGGRLVFSLVPTLDSGTTLFADVTAEFVDAGGGEGEFDGRLTLEVKRAGATSTHTIAARFGLARQLIPVLHVDDTLVTYFGDTVTIPAEGLILGSGEGSFELLAQGDFVGDDGKRTHLDEVPLAVSVPSRHEARYLQSPDFFGLRTGEFTGTLKAVNQHKGGRTLESDPTPVSIVILPSEIVSVSPTGVSREQRVRLSGRGFFEDRESGAATLARLRGTFTPREGAAKALSLDLPITVEASDKGRLVLQPVLDEGELVGFGAVPGRFTGSITPVINAGDEELEGEKWQGSLEVLPTKQIVHLKFLPGFTDALRNYGLRNVERHVRDRIFEVVRRDYAGYNVEFREDRPTDWEKWSTVELTGDDPNAADLFGLDNSSGKDEGNLRLNDYVGGTNAEQVESGSFAFGGVFVASFMRFSPNVCRKSDENGNPYYLRCKGASSHPMATQRFDDFFAAFSPLLLGTEASASEWDSGARKAKVRDAVRVLGNIIGNTCTHEFGHSLGLAQEIGLDEFHNAGDTTGVIMNPGGARPFAERAETTDTYNGITEPMGPAVWAPGDAEYLAKILPVE